MNASTSPKFCMECGGALPAGAKFCPSCGTKVAAVPPADSAEASSLVESTAEAPAAAPTAPEIPSELRAKYETARAALRGDRREVVVLFADVSGFTSMSESLDPEEVSFLMHGLLGELAGVVHRYEGYVDKYIGDAIMALFGAPLAHEDDPERALLAALDMLETLKQWNATAGRSLALRIGLNLGEVVAGHMGSDARLQYTVMGDTVNVASRLEGAAELDSVLISEALWRRVRRDFVTEEVPPLDLKGKAEAVRAFRVDRHEPGYAAAEHVSPFVGRRNELARVESLFAQLGEGESAALVLEGEAGAGKTRLLAEATARVRREAGEDGTAPRTIEVGFAPLRLPGQNTLSARIFRRIVEPGDDAGVAAALALLGDGADDHRAGVLGLARESDPTRAPDGEPEVDPEAARQNRWLALAALLRSAARTRTVVLVVEDVHWADEAAQELVEFMLSNLEPGLGAILTVRPTPGAPWIPDSIERLPLSPLGAEEARALLGPVLDELRPRERQDLFRRSEGNPLYLEELARSLREGGGAAGVPGSLQGMIRSRIDRLDPPVQMTLQMAAVLGPRFPEQLLARMFRIEPQPIAFDEALRSLEESGFIAPLDPRGDGEGGVVDRRFLHTLAQEVSYRGLLNRVKRILHESAARLGQELYAERAEVEAPFFAHHFWMAGLEVEAASHLWIAGRDAAAAFDLPAAETWLERATRVVTEHDEAIPEPVTRAALSETAGMVLLQRGRLDEAEERFGALEAIGATEGRSEWTVRGTEYRGRIAWYRGRLDEARNLFQEALDRHDRDDDTIAADLHNDLGLVGWYCGDGEGAHIHLERGYQLRRALDDRLGMAKSLSNLGNLLVDLGDDLDGAEERYTRALELAEEISDRKMRTIALNNLGRVHMERGAWGRAIDRYERAGSIAEETGWSFMRHVCLLNEAYCEVQLGRIAPALHKLETCRRHGDEILEPVNRINVRLHEFEAWLRAMALERAQTAMEEARELVDALGVAEMEDEVLLVEGRWQETQGAWSDAADTFEKAAARAAALHHTAVERLARAHRCRAFARAGLEPPEASPTDPGGRAPAEAILTYLAADTEASVEPTPDVAGMLARAAETAAALGDPSLERAALERRAEVLRALGDDPGADEASGRAAKAMRALAENLPEALRPAFLEHPRNASLSKSVPDSSP